MELREIELEDVYPDEKNPRKDFGNIAALAESCMPVSYTHLGRYSSIFGPVFFDSDGISVAHEPRALHQRRAPALVHGLVIAIQRGLIGVGEGPDGFAAA